MICPRCGGTVPPNQLACNCFQLRADEELEQRSLANFALGRQAMYLTPSGHLLPHPSMGITLCRLKRFQSSHTERVWRHQVDAMNSPRGFCWKCYEKARAALSAQ